MTRGFSYLPKHTAEISHQALAYEKVETKKQKKTKKKIMPKFVCVCAWILGYTFSQVISLKFQV